LTLTAAMLMHNYSDLVLPRAYSILVYVYAKIEYVSVRMYLSKSRIRTLRRPILEPCSTPGKALGGAEL